MCVCLCAICISVIYTQKEESLVFLHPRLNFPLLDSEIVFVEKARSRSLSELFHI